MSTQILSADIGGTNTSIAVIEHENATFTLLARQVYQTHAIQSFSEALHRAMEVFERELEELRISSACLSIAGPVKNNHAIPTNISWTLDGREIEQEFGFETTVINDFTALCYGIPLLDINNPQKITVLPHPDGTIPTQQDHLPGIGVSAVVGAGTGLGVGYLIEEADRILALPAEGGHSDFHPYGATGRELALYMEKKAGQPLNAERLVSGGGLVNIFHFMKDEKGANSRIIRDIASLEDREKPRAISRQAHNDETCRTIIALFVEMYARIAHNFALAYIPRRGLFIAGGIAAKNKEFFLEDNRFMKIFLHNINPIVRPLLADIPVYIVEDYRTSLYGAAHALVQTRKILKKR